VLERIRHDGPAISALDVSLRGPTAEVRFHFDCFLHSL
jgi:hypothetical protein